LAQATLCSMRIQLALEKRAQHPNPVFGPCLLWPNGWMDQDATWYGGKPRPTRCVRCGCSTPCRGTALPVFGSCLLWPNGWMDEDTPLFGSCLLWPWSPISATSELLLIGWFKNVHCNGEISGFQWKLGPQIGDSIC